MTKNNYGSGGLSSTIYYQKGLDEGPIHPDRSYIESHISQLFLYGLIISIFFFRINKNILRYIFNLIIDFYLIISIYNLFIKITHYIETIIGIDSIEHLNTSNYIILSIISSGIIFVLSLIILSIKIKLLNKYFKYGGESNNFKNALFKEMLKFCLPIIILTFMSYGYTIYDTLKNPTF